MPYFRNQNNLKLYYELINGAKGKDIEKPVIILLHGFGSSANFFSEQIDILNRDYTLLFFDAEGHGKSEKNLNEDYTAHLMDSMVNDLLELLFLLGIDGPFGIIGHSLVGGGIAIQLATLFPEKVDFLILLNSGTIVIDNPIRNVFWNLLPQTVRMHFKELIEDNLEELLSKMIPFIRGALLEEGEYSDAFYNKFDGLIESEIFDMIQKNLDPSGIKCPVLVIGAELDNYAPVWMSKELAEKIPNARFEVVTMTGHFGPAQRPDEYNKLILEFLSEIKRKK
ncbi:MAG: alpha/beta fold hydrolase [Promethearchaeota archaeon]